MPKRTGLPVPPPGSYHGTVDGALATFVVQDYQYGWQGQSTALGVWAWWLIQGADGEPKMVNEAWEVKDGRFVPTRYGHLLDCRIRRGSKVAAPTKRSGEIGGGAAAVACS